MTATQFSAWKRWVYRSRQPWQLDPVQNGSEHRSLLLYCGGNAFGKYLSISPQGALELGSYTGNPLKGGRLSAEGCKNYGSRGAAIDAAVNKGHLAFVMNFLGF